MSSDARGIAFQPLRSTDPEVLGRHRLVGRLGAGGMGVVYVADGPLGRVAVKLVRPELADDPEFRVRFQREVQACFRVSSPRTARLVDFELDADQPWLATEFVDAPDLAVRVRAAGPLSIDDQLVLAQGLAEALASVHEAGLVHRDLKPSNVLWTDDGPKVIDFGIAASTGARPLTTVGGLIGTPGWLSPEQVTGGEVTAATDVFAWGALLAFAATGKPPFGEGPSEAVLHRVQFSEPQIDDDKLAPALRPLVHRALSRDPAARPTARDLFAVLVGVSGADSTAVLSAAVLSATEPSQTPGLGSPVPPTRVQSPDDQADDTTSVGPTRVARPGRPSRRTLAYAGAVAVVLAVAGTVAALLVPGDESSAAPGHEAAQTLAEDADFTTDSPWRLVIRDMIEGQDNGCDVTVKEIVSGEQDVFTGVYGTKSFQIPVIGSFQWDVNDPGCLVIGRPGPGTAVLPFAHEAWTGDTDAFGGFDASAPIAVEVIDYSGSEECDLVLHDAADGQALDFGTARSGTEDTLYLDPNGRSQVYLADPPCGVRVSAG